MGWDGISLGRLANPLHPSPTPHKGVGFEVQTNQKNNQLPMTITDYSKYTHRVSTDPTYYGSCVSAIQGKLIAQAICKLVESEFPGIQTELWSDGEGSCSTTGPHEETIDAINIWISNNWTAAL